MTANCIFYDGLTSDRHQVTVDVASGIITAKGLDGALMAQWRFDTVYPLASSDDVLRIGVDCARVAARLEIADAALAAVLRAGFKKAGRSPLTTGRTRLKVVACSLAAIAVLLAGAVWGGPPLAQRIAPHLPAAWEARLGDVADQGLRRTLDKGRPLECGTGDGARAAAARNAFNKLIAALENAAGLPLPVRAAVVRTPVVNAVSLPGGRLYVFDGLLNKAVSVDEVAGVISHELGHLAHHDGTTGMLGDIGLSMAFGMVLNDATGGGSGAAVFATKVILNRAYSRSGEIAADEFSARLMYKVGGDPRALGAFLLRTSSGKDGTVPDMTPRLMLDHPESPERDAALAGFPRPSPLKALLTPIEWSALKAICREDEKPRQNPGHDNRR